MSHNASATDANGCIKHPDVPNVDVLCPGGASVRMCSECAMDIASGDRPHPSDEANAHSYSTCPYHPDAPQVEVSGPEGGVIHACRACAEAYAPLDYHHPGAEQLASSDAM